MRRANLVRAEMDDARLTQCRAEGIKLALPKVAELDPVSLGEAERVPCPRLIGIEPGTPERMRKSIDVAHEAAKQYGRKPSDIVATVGLPVFLHNDLKVAYAAAQRGLAFYGALPFYSRLIARSGFESAATAIMEAAKRAMPARWRPRSPSR
jgi:hypothetical protein